MPPRQQQQSDVPETMREIAMIAISHLKFETLSKKVQKSIDSTTTIAATVLIKLNCHFQLIGRKEKSF
jgi:hypothetical protein